MAQINRRTLLRSLATGLGAYSLPSLSTAVQAATTAYNRPKLKITDVRTAEVRVHGYRLRPRRRAVDQGVAWLEPSQARRPA